MLWQKGFVLILAVVYLSTFLKQTDSMGEGGKRIIDIMVVGFIIYAVPIFTLGGIEFSPETREIRMIFFTIQIIGVSIFLYGLGKLTFKRFKEGYNGK